MNTQKKKGEREREREADKKRNKENTLVRKKKERGKMLNLSYGIFSLIS